MKSVHFTAILAFALNVVVRAAVAQTAPPPQPLPSDPVPNPLYLICMPIIPDPSEFIVVSVAITEEPVSGIPEDRPAAKVERVAVVKDLQWPPAETLTLGKNQFSISRIASEPSRFRFVNHLEGTRWNCDLDLSVDPLPAVSRGN